VLQLEEASDVLNVQCVDLLARELGEELRVAMVTTDWLSLPKPRAVSPYVERLVLYAARVLGTFGSSTTGSRRACGRHGCRRPRCPRPSSTSRASSRRSSPRPL
jgi:hypothetical protein